MHNHKKTLLGVGVKRGLEKFAAFSVWGLFASLFFCIPGVVYADSVAISNISFSNPQITASAGTIVFADPWNTQAFAEAQNSLGEHDKHFDSHTGAPSKATATVSYAGATGKADVAPLDGAASSYATLVPNDPIPEADSKGRGTLYNFFEITGGTGSVDVTFSADIAGALLVATDDDGLLAQTETIFGLELDGQPILFFDKLLSVGPDSFASAAFGKTLSTTTALNFDTPYFVLAQGDSESVAVLTPEPPTALLLFSALLGAAACVGKKS